MSNFFDFTEYPWVRFEELHYKDPSKVEHLRFSHDWIDLSAIPDLPNLRRLDLADAKYLRPVWDPSRFEKLTELHLVRSQLKHTGACVPDWTAHPVDGVTLGLVAASMPRLDTLGLHRLEGLLHLDAFSCLKTVRLIDIWYCDDLQDVSAVRTLPNLRDLRIMGCEVLEDFRGINETSITHLEVCGMESVKDFDFLVGLETLEELVIDFRTETLSLEGLTSLPNLRTLKLECLAEELDLAPLAELPKLESVNLMEAHRLRKARGLGKLHAKCELPESNAYGPVFYAD